MVTKVQQSSPGAWASTVTGVGLGRRLFTYEEGGKLYSTSTQGQWKVLGDDYATRLLFADGTNQGFLYAIEESGTLYKIDPDSGEWEQLGEDGAWDDVVAADAVNGTVYFVDEDGLLQAGDPTSGEDFEELGEGYDTDALWVWQGYVYVLETDGTLYKVNTHDGEYEQFGDEGAYDDTLAATMHNGVFYAIEDDGALGATRLEDGAYEELTGADLSDTREIFSAGGKLYVIDDVGTLFSLEL